MKTMQKLEMFSGIATLFTAVMIEFFLPGFLVKKARPDESIVFWILLLLIAPSLLVSIGYIFMY